MFNIGHQVYDLKEALGFPGIQSQYKQPLSLQKKVKC